MKLMIVTPYFYPKVGGLENYAWNIAKGLEETYGWEIVVITSNHKEKKYAVEEIDGIKIYRLPVLFTLSNTPINPLWYFTIKRIISEESPAIINAHTPVPFIADMAILSSKKIPVFITYHSGSMKKGKFLLDVIIKVYEDLILPMLFRSAYKIICASNFVKKTVARNYSYKSSVVYPGVDIHLFKPTTIEKPLKPTVLFIGRHEVVNEMKGLYILIKAMKEIPYAKLKIIGEKSNVEGENIEFAGIKTGKDLVKEIQKSSVVVLASIAPMESFGMVLLEAMACKIPVIGTTIGGIPEVITNGKDGLLVPIKDVQALRIAIKRIIDNQELASEMGRNGYNKVRDKFTWEKTIKETYRLFATAL